MGSGKGRARRVQSAVAPAASVSLSAVATEMAELTAEIAELDRLYYQESISKVPDETYDMMFARLLELEEENPALRSEDSPTNKISDGLGSTFAKVEHLVPMLSLDKAHEVHDPERLHKWLN